MVCWTSQIALSKDANPMGSWSQVVGFLHTVDKFSISALLSANFCVKIFSLAHLHTLFRFYGVKKKIVYFPFLNLLLITLCNSLHLSYFYWSTTISWTHYLKIFFFNINFPPNALLVYKKFDNCSCLFHCLLLFVIFRCRHFSLTIFQRSQTIVSLLIWKLR